MTAFTPSRNRNRTPADALLGGYEHETSAGDWASATGAAAVGALAVGALAIGRLVIRRVVIAELRIQRAFTSTGWVVDVRDDGPRDVPRDE